MFVSVLSEPLTARNTSLDYLQGTLGYSYMCSQELVLTVGQNFSLNMFHLQVQPFGVSGNDFGEGSLILTLFLFVFTCTKTLGRHITSMSLIFFL